jgi:hypothetical protein
MKFRIEGHAMKNLDLTEIWPEFRNQVREIELAKELGIKWAHVCLVGSTLICGKGNDADFLCLVPKEEVVTQHGFEPDIEVQYESDLRSFRRGDQNLIVTTNANFFFAEVAIAHAARLVANDKFDMGNRDERIRFHSAVRGEVVSRLAEDVV